MLASHQRAENLEREGLPNKHEEPASIETLKTTPERERRLKIESGRDANTPRRCPVESPKENPRGSNARAEMLVATTPGEPEAGLQTAEDRLAMNQQARMRRRSRDSEQATERFIRAADLVGERAEDYVREHARGVEQQRIDAIEHPAMREE